MSYTYLFKFIVVGDSGVGKSCLLLRFADDYFRNMHEATIGVEFGSRQVEVDGTSLNLQIWDTAGQESFHSIVRAYYRGATAALLVFDLSNQDSFASLEKWLLEIQENAHEAITTVLVGNKLDLPGREVSTETAKTFAEEHGLLYTETSALTGENVESSFLLAAQEVLTKVRQHKVCVPKHEPNLKPAKKQRSCCSNS